MPFLSGLYYIKYIILNKTVFTLYQISIYIIYVVRFYTLEVYMKPMFFFHWSTEVRFMWKSCCHAYACWCMHAKRHNVVLIVMYIQTLLLHSYIVNKYALYIHTRVDMEVQDVRFLSTEADRRQYYKEAKDGLQRLSCNRLGVVNTNAPPQKRSCLEVNDPFASLRSNVSEIEHSE